MTWHEMQWTDMTWNEKKIKLYEIKWNDMNEWQEMKFKLNDMTCMSWKEITWSYERNEMPWNEINLNECMNESMN